VDTPPSEEDYKGGEWQKPHQPNLTGTPAAYRPRGSVLGNRHRPRVDGDYDAWTPGG
jgi:NADH:ubiquinone oxidoreductase subunit